MGLQRNQAEVKGKNRGSILLSERKEWEEGMSSWLRLGVWCKVKGYSETRGKTSAECPGWSWSLGGKGI